MTLISRKLTVGLIVVLLDTVCRATLAQTDAAPIPSARPKLNVSAPVLLAKYVTDSRLRSLALARYNAHDTLTRDDMLDLFREVEKEGPVSAAALKSLQAIVADSQAIGIDGYVSDLSAKVVCGDPANANFQGSPLGDLHLGSGPEHLERLVKKWFLGADRPAIDAGLHYEFAKGRLFNGIPRISDMNQGSLGDCYFISSLGATALADWQAIAGMFIDNGDGTLTVQFYHDGQPSYVTIDRFLPVDGNHNLAYDGSGTSAANATNVLWVALAEKAFAQLNESCWIHTTGPAGVNTYAAIGAGGSGSQVIPALTGIAASYDGAGGLQGLNLREPMVATSGNRSDFELHAYTLATDGSKQANSITVPNNANVRILAIAAAPATGPSKPVDLRRAFNLEGITAEGQKFSGGFDGQGYALPGHALGDSLSAEGVKFELGAVGAANVVQAAGQTIRLPAGALSKLVLLGTGVNGNQPDQAFVVQYSDGTSQAFTQGISDWYMAQNYPGESLALKLAYRNICDGGKDGDISPKIVTDHAYAVVGYNAKTRAVTLFNPHAKASGGFAVYGYTLALDPAKTVTGVTLPNNANLTILAVAETPSTGEAMPVDLARAFNLVGITVDRQKFSAGLDAQGSALSANLLGRSLVWGGVRFNLGAAGAANVVQSTGQLIALPAGSISKLELLATAVNGNQLNQEFVVHYADGTSQALRQSFSDWWMPRHYKGESVAKVTAYRNSSNVHEQFGRFTVSWTEFVSSFTGVDRASQPLGKL